MTDFRALDAQVTEMADTLEKARAEIARMKEALTILRDNNPLHNDWDAYLSDVAYWGLGEDGEREDGLTGRPEWKE